MAKIEQIKKEHPEDSASFFTAYRDCAKDGIALCQYQFALMMNTTYRQMDGLYMLAKAAAQKHVKAPSELVYMYFDGVKGIVENDITKARNLCENVAAAKKSVALLMLGIM